MIFSKYFLLSLFWIWRGRVVFLPLAASSFKELTVPTESGSRRLDDWRVAHSDCRMAATRASPQFYAYTGNTYKHMSVCVCVGRRRANALTTVNNSSTHSHTYRHKHRDTLTYTYRNILARHSLLSSCWNAKSLALHSTNTNNTCWEHSAPFLQLCCLLLLPPLSLSLAKANEKAAHQWCTVVCRALITGEQFNHLNHIRTIFVNVLKLWNKSLNKFTFS